MDVSSFGPKLLSHSDGALMHEISVPACRCGDTGSKYTDAIGTSVPCWAVREAQAFES